MTMINIQVNGGSAELINNDILNIMITANHGSPNSMATVETYEDHFSLGTSVTILGQNPDTAEWVTLFAGIVKQIEEKVDGEQTYVYTLYDPMIRAQDYFIAPSDPAQVLTFNNISAEELVSRLMLLAGLQTLAAETFFTFGIKNSFEVNLVSSYDYCRTIADLLTWTLYWDHAEQKVRFENRKPYYMADSAPENLQPGWIEDTPTGYILNTDVILGMTHSYSEKDVRNRVVVYGGEGIAATAEAVSPWLPTNFYKTSVLGFPQLVEDQGMAQDIADYNLNLFHRLTESLSVNIVGNFELRARTVIEFSDARFPELAGYWYIFGCDQNFSTDGYTTNLELRKMTKP